MKAIRGYRIHSHTGMKVKHTGVVCRYECIHIKKYKCNIIYVMRTSARPPRGKD